MFNTIEEALYALTQGEVIIVVDDEDRENEGDLLALADYADGDVINFMATHGKGLICTPIHCTLADQLQLHPMVSHNTDNHQTAFTVTIDHQTTTTGISAFERADTIAAMLNPYAVAEEFRRPGHVFPLVAKEGGVLTRNGHTEAAVDLAQLAGATPAGVICEVMKENGEMARLPELLILAQKFNLKLITIADLIQYRQRIVREATINLPTAFGNFKMIGYGNTIDNKEHLTLFKGDIQKQPPLVRIHSECLTGDVFASLRCDCGPQLQTAMQQIEQEGAGIILYMRQEGRGIGLINKLKTYELQEEGMDTVEANEALGFAAELRDYALCAQMLRDLGVTTIRLLTNNPDKVTQLEEHGIIIAERLPLIAGLSPINATYMQTKQQKMAHLLEANHK